MSNTAVRHDHTTPEYRQLVGRAHDLIPELVAAAAETERAGMILPSIVARFHEAGLFRMVQPRSVGGLGLEGSIFFDVGAELSRGCASTSWVLGNLASHHLLQEHWPLAAQDEVWGQSPDTLIGSSYVFPAGKAEKVDGGWMVSGRWPFSSGIDPCQWVQVGAMVPGADGKPTRRYFLLPREHYVIHHDSWDTAGLRGTGSKDIEVAPVFVPEHRSVDYLAVVEGRSPGLERHPEPLFRFPLWATGGYVLLATLYGTASAALERFVAGARTSVARSSGGGIASQSTVQQRIAKAAALLDAVELVARRRLYDSCELVAREGRLPVEYGAKVRRDGTHCAQMCVEAIDLLFAAGGGSALYHDNPLQRAWRDIHAGAANLTLQWDVTGPAIGRYMLGLPAGLPGLP